MFDHIGRDQDDEAARRRAVSLGIVFAATAVAGFCAGAIATLAPRPPILEVVEPPMVFLDVSEPRIEEQAPAAPAVSKGEKTAEPVRPDSADPYPAPLPPTPPEGPQAARAGDPDGTADGVPDGKLDGTGLGTGECTGDDCGRGRGPVYLHHSELTILRQTSPKYPASARGLGLGEVKCMARIAVDVHGRVTEVDVDACPPAFQNETRAALLQWRFAPATREDGVLVEARSLIAVNYRR